jgi:hypothetical protein
MQEEFQDTKIAIRIRKSTNRQTIQCPETKADEPRGQEVRAGRKEAERRLKRRQSAEIRRIKGNDSAYFGRFNNRTVVLVYHIFNSVSDLLKIFLISTILYFFQLIFISYMHMCLFSSLIYVTSDDGRRTLQWYRFSTIRLLVSAIYRNFDRVKYMIHRLLQSYC